MLLAFGEVLYTNPVPDRVPFCMGTKVPVHVAVIGGKSYRITGLVPLEAAPIDPITESPMLQGVGLRVSQLQTLRRLIGAWQQSTGERRAGYVAASEQLALVLEAWAVLT